MSAHLALLAIALAGYSLIYVAAFTPNTNKQIVIPYFHPAITYSPPLDSWDFPGLYDYRSTSQIVYPGTFPTGQTYCQTNITRDNSNNITLSFYGAGISPGMAYTPSSPNGRMVLSFSMGGTTDIRELISGAPIPNPVPLRGQPTVNVWPGTVSAPSVNVSSHVLTMTMSGTVLSFHDFQFTTMLQTQADPNNLLYQRYTSLVRADRLNPAFVCSGSWELRGTLVYGGSTELGPSVMIGSPGSVCSIELPANASYLAINGSMDYQRGTVLFKLSTDPPVQGLPRIVSTASRYASVSGLYETPLDPAVQYNLSIIVGSDGPVGIGGVALTAGLNDTNWAAGWGTHDARQPPTATDAPQPPTASHTYGISKDSKTPIGTIVGGAIGGVVALLAVICAVTLALRKRRQKAWGEKQGPAWDISSVNRPSLEPFAPSHVQAASSEVEGTDATLQGSPGVSTLRPISRGPLGGLAANIMVASAGESSTERQQGRPISKAEEAALQQSDSSKPAAECSAPILVIHNPHDEDAGALPSLQPPLPPVYDPNWSQPQAAGHDGPAESRAEA